GSALVKKRPLLQGKLHTLIIVDWEHDYATRH
ncbi:MAG: hypothetical protein JWN63_3344, partial [Candidatus Acidoferrum typicum]|nr:hypothetical protein [Candidatus Acidoferrum typicum]